MSPPERLLAVTGRVRGGRLDRGLPAALEPSPAALAQAAAAAPAAAFTLDGGEPTLRADLPALVEALSGLPRLGLRTDAQALASPERLHELRRWGLQRLRVDLHSARPEAHDWLVDLPGAHRRALRALRLAAQAGLEPEVEVVLTRPAVDQLPELVALALELGARRVVVRRLLRRGPAAAQYIALSPRLGLAQPVLEAAADLARARGRPLVLRGFPACAAGRAAPAVQDPTLCPWLCLDEALARHLAPPEALPGCAPCPGPPACAGAPADYVERFGWAELRSEDHGRAPPAPTRADPCPPPRAGRSPATRLSWPQRALSLPGLGADPVGDRPGPAPARLRFALEGPAPLPCPACGDADAALPAWESTRAARARLVQLAQQGAAVIEVGGAQTLHHPDALELLREATTLPVARVEAWGDGAALAAQGAGALRRLRHLHHLSLALTGHAAPQHDAHAGREGAFAATLQAAEMLQNQGTPTSVYAVLHRNMDLPGWDAAWASGALPGAPAFALSPLGGDLGALSAAARGASPAARAALAPLLPPCLGGQPAPNLPPALPAWTPARTGRISGLSPRPAFTPCPRAAGCDQASGCPGLAVGWTLPPPAAVDPAP